MGNQAIIAKIDRVIEIPGANTIQVGVVLGESVIISKDWGVGKVGVLFPVGVQLSEKMVMYKGVLLAKNSDAYKLWLEKEFKKLDEHMERLNKEAKKRGDYYE